MAVKFTDNSAKVLGAMNDAVLAYLYEAGGELETQVKRNTRVGKGDTKNAWKYVVDESKVETVVGNPLENSIWEEFGTGEFALHGDGRKGGWYYQDEKGKWHHTYGKTPHRAFKRAFDSLKNVLIKRAGEVLKARLK